MVSYGQAYINCMEELDCPLFKLVDPLSLSVGHVDNSYLLHGDPSFSHHSSQSMGFDLPSKLPVEVSTALVDTVARPLL